MISMNNLNTYISTLLIHLFTKKNKKNLTCLNITKLTNSVKPL